MTKGPGPLVAACSAIAGDPIRNAQGDELGTLEHVMLDVASGCIAYGVLARGGVLGLGAKLFAVPWHALRRDPAHDCFVLDVALERLRQAPRFDREHWPQMADPAFTRSVEEFYRGARAEGHPALQ